jgi:hypothetical protein
MERGELQVGDRVRTMVKGQRPRVGYVLWATDDGLCWVIRTPKGLVTYHKSLCERVRSSQMSKQARAIRPMGLTKM